MIRNRVRCIRAPGFVRKSALGLTLGAILFLALSSSDVTATPPVVLTTTLLSGDAAQAPAAGTQHREVVSRGGDRYLAVWEDLRSDLDHVAVAAGNSQVDLFAALLDAAGHPLHPISIPIAVDRNDQTWPRVAWNGQNWLVAWQTVVPADVWYTGQIVAVRVSPEGVVLDDPPIRIYTFQHDSDQMGNVSSDGTNWLIVWKQVVDGSTWSYRAARIAPSGGILDPGGVVVLTSDQYPAGPEIAFAGDEYLFVWSVDGILGRRIATNLAPLGPVFVIAPHQEFELYPSVATDGTNFCVSYQRGDAFSGQILGARLDHSGHVLDAAGVLLSTANMFSTTARNSSVAWNGTDWLVAWTEDRGMPSVDDVYLNRLSPAGVARDGTGHPLESAPTDQGEVRAVSATGGTHVFWVDARAGGPFPEDIDRAFVSAAMTAGPTEAISLALPSQTEPYLAPDSAGYTVAFRTETSGVRRIAVERTDALGQPAWAEPVVVASGPNLATPSIAWNGSVLLVVWEDRDLRRIFGRRLGIDGGFLDASPIAIMSGNTPDVAALGDLFLVVDSYEPTNHMRFPFAVRVRGSDGAVLDPVQVQIGGLYSTSPRVAALGTNWIVVWQQNLTHDSPLSSITGRLVSTSGTPLTVFNPSTTGTSVRAPDVTSTGSSALVAWTLNFGTNPVLRGRRVNAAGALLEPADFVVSDPPLVQSDVAVTWDGSQYVLGFQDQRVNNPIIDKRSDLYGARLSASLMILDPDGFPIATSPNSEIQPDVASLGGNSLFAGAWFQPEPDIGAYRVGLRMMLGRSATSVAEGGAEGAGGPDVARLLFTAGPNPFREGIAFAVSMPGAGPAEVTVTDVSGRTVHRIFRGLLPAGTTRLAWDGRGDDRVPVTRGVYFVGVATDHGSQHLKVIRR